MKTLGDDRSDVHPLDRRVEMREREQPWPSAPHSSGVRCVGTAMSLGSEHSQSSTSHDDAHPPSAGSKAVSPV